MSLMFVESSSRLRQYVSICSICQSRLECNICHLITCAASHRKSYMTHTIKAVDHKEHVTSVYIVWPLQQNS